ncbi:oligosaccharide repeat unit polymerase [Empedobacter falsenii]
MLQKEKILSYIESNKPTIWGLFLSSLIPAYAINNILLIVVSIFFLITIFIKKRIYLNKSTLPFIVLFGWGILSYFWSTYPIQTLSTYPKTIGFLIIPLAINQYKQFSIKELNKTISIFSYSLILYFFISLTYATYIFLQKKSIHVFFYHDLVTIFENNAIYIALFTSICLLIKFNIPSKSKIDNLIISILYVYLILLSSKNLLITTTILLLFSILYQKKNIFLKKIYIIPFLIIGGIIAFINNPIKQRFLDEATLNFNQIFYGQDFTNFEFTGSNLRLFQWRIVYEMVYNNQLGFLGNGLGNIDYLTEQYFHYYNLYKGYFIINFHNEFLQIYGELGVIGLLILIYIFSLSLYKSIKTKNVYLFVITVILILSFFTESYLNRQKGLIIFTTIICLLLMTNIKNKMTSTK